jgi:hypothetical protein
MKCVRCGSERRTPVNCHERVEIEERHRNGEVMLAPDELGGDLLTVQVVPGIEAAPVRSGLLRGTAGTCVAMRRERHKRRSREADSTNGQHRVGAARSSEEASVMEVERRGCVIQLEAMVNCNGRRSH